MQEKIVLLILKRKTKLPKTSQHIALESVRLCGQTGTLKIRGKNSQSLQQEMQQPPCVLVSQDCSRDTRLSPAPTSSCKGLQSHCLCALPRRVFLSFLQPAGSGGEPASGGGRLGDDSRAAWNAVNEPTPTPEQQLTRHGSLWLRSAQVLS